MTDSQDHQDHHKLHHQLSRTFSQKRSIQTYRHATSKWGCMLENFTPMWFAICIGSGGLASVLNSPFPYPARWLEICGTILYIVDLVTFLLFSGIMITRWILYPHVAVRKLLSSPEELAAYGIWPISLLTISALTASQVSSAYWGGHAFSIVAYVLWWIGVMWQLVTGVVVIIIIAQTGQVIDSKMTPALFLPVVGLATAAVEGGTITNKAVDFSTRLAVPQLVVSYFLLGIALFLAMMLYPIFLHRLMATGWPKPPAIAALAILVGPAGQSATAFLVLGTAAGQKMRFAEYARGTFFTQEVGQVFYGASFLLGFLLIGLAIFWMIIALYGVVDLAFVRREFTYTLTWWAIVFPLITLDTALVQLASAMDSPAFRVLATALFVLILIFYILNWAFTILNLFTGKILMGPSMVELEKQEEERRGREGQDESV